MHQATTNPMYNFRVLSQGFPIPDEHSLRKFASLPEHCDRIDMVNDLNKDTNDRIKFVKDVKFDKVAAIHTDRGIALYQNGMHKDALDSFRKALRIAESDEQKAYVYANRAFALMRRRMFKECSEDCTRALEHCCTSEIMKCLTMYLKYLTEDLNNSMRTGLTAVLPEECQENLDSSVFACLDIEMDNYDQVFIKLMQRRRHLMIQTPRIPSQRKNCFLECASKRIEMKTNDEYGTHIVAKEGLIIGEVLIVDKPFAHCLFYKDGNHCSGCLKLCYALIPCETCKQVMYCSESCKQKTFEHYHKYECPILPTLSSLGCPERDVLALRLVIKGRKTFLVDGCQNYEPMPTYKSDNADELLFLQNGLEDLSTKELYRMCSMASIMHNLLKQHTDFFTEVPNEKLFQEILLRMMSTVRINEIMVHELGPCHTSGRYLKNNFATAVYNAVSLINHSCRPNAEVYFYGQTAVVRAIRNIPAGEQVFISYGPIYYENHRRQRQRVLAYRYRFVCKCLACKEYFPLFLLMRREGVIREIRFKKYVKMLRRLETSPRYLTRIFNYHDLIVDLGRTEMCEATKDYVVLWKLVRLVFSLMANSRFV